MRLDKWLKVSRLTKRRTVANETSKLRTKKTFICAAVLLFAILTGILAGCGQKEPEYMSGGWWGTVGSNFIKDGNRVIRIFLSDIDTDGMYFILTLDTHVESNLSVEQISPGDFIRMNVLNGIRTEEGIVCIELIIHPPFGQD